MKKIASLALSLMLAFGFLLNAPGRASANANTDLYSQIMSYRQANQLPSIPISPELTAVAKAHVQDLMQYSTTDPNYTGPDCVFHGWSTHGDGKWQGGCYKFSDQNTYGIMWNKPKEISNYPSPGYEILYWTVGAPADAAGALKAWQSDAPHDDVIRNKDIWADMTWNAIGVWVEGNFASVWFGVDADPSPADPNVLKGGNDDAGNADNGADNPPDDNGNVDGDENPDDGNADNGGQNDGNADDGQTDDTGNADDGQTDDTGNAGDDQGGDTGDTGGGTDADDVNTPVDDGERSDRDGDGLFDDDETDVYGTDPDSFDSDVDGYSDGQEVFDGTDPLDPQDFKEFEGDTSDQGGDSTDTSDSGNSTDSSDGGNTTGGTDDQNTDDGGTGDTGGGNNDENAPPACVDAEEFAFLTLINDYRAANGLQPLTLVSTLTAAADVQSQDMAAKNFLGHDGSNGSTVKDRIDASGSKTNTWWGENVFAGDQTAQGAFDWWKQSPGHNANMLSANFTTIGIARAFNQNAQFGWYWTTDFGNAPEDATCASPAENDQNADGDNGDDGGTDQQGDGNDRDGDGLTDDDELNTYGTDPDSFDTDGGGAGDGEEIFNGTDPFDSSDDGNGGDADTQADQDDDGLFDVDETDVYGTDPSNFDTDGDGVGDGEEIFNGTDPLDFDSN